MTEKWKIEYNNQALKDYRKLGIVTKKVIMKFLKEKLAKASHPTAYGKQLTGTMKHLWCYRVGDYRILAQHQKEIVTILVVKIAHRSKVYR